MRTHFSPALPQPGPFPHTALHKFAQSRVAIRRNRVKTCRFMSQMRRNLSHTICQKLAPAKAIKPSHQNTYNNQTSRRPATKPAFPTNGPPQAARHHRSPANNPTRNNPNRNHPRCNNARNTTPQHGQYLPQQLLHRVAWRCISVATPPRPVANSQQEPNATKPVTQCPPTTYTTTPTHPPATTPPQQLPHPPAPATRPRNTPPQHATRNTQPTTGNRQLPTGNYQLPPRQSTDYGPLTNDQ
jgi:hypothetical protein